MMFINNLVRKLSKLPSPDKTQLAAVQAWLEYYKDENNLSDEPELHVWNETESEKYFVLMDATINLNAFTKLVTNVAYIFVRLFGSRLQLGKIIDKRSELKSYSDKRITKVSNILVAMISSALPVLAIFVSFNLETTTLRIYLTLVFTVVFALILALFSSATQVEILTATAT